MYLKKFYERYDLPNDILLDFDIINIKTGISIDDLEYLFENYKYDYMEKLKKVQEGTKTIKKEINLDNYVINRICYFCLQLDKLKKGEIKRINKYNKISNKYIDSSKINKHK